MITIVFSVFLMIHVRSRFNWKLWRAKESLQEQKEVRLVWSFMHEDENIFCPFLERKIEVARLSTICKIRIGPGKEIYNLAKDFQRRAKLSAKDAIHLACAYHAKCRYFLTCDNELIKRAKRLNLEIKIMNPVEYIREVEK